MYIIQGPIYFKKGALWIKQGTTKFHMTEIYNMRAISYEYPISLQENCWNSTMEKRQIRMGRLTG